MNQFRFTSVAAALCHIVLAFTCLKASARAEDFAFPPDSLELLLDVAYPEDLIDRRSYLEAVPASAEDIAVHRVELSQIPGSVFTEAIQWMEKIMKPEALPPVLVNLTHAFAPGNAASVYPAVIALKDYRGLEAKDLRKAIGRKVTLPSGQVITYPGLNPAWKGSDIIQARRTTPDAMIEVREKGGVLEFTVIYRMKPEKTGHELIRETLQRFTRIPAEALSQLDMSEVTQNQKLWCGSIYCGIKANDPDVAGWVYEYSDWWGLMLAITDDRFVYFSIEEVEPSKRRGKGSFERF